MNKLSSLASVSATRAVLENHGLSTKYSLGQNFLVNDSVVRKTVDLAQVEPSDYVIEVGPGIGTLTIALLKRAGFVVAIERDPDLAAVLHDTLMPGWDHVHLIEKDALDLQLEDLQIAPVESVAPAMSRAHQLPNKFVANLPYAVAATIVLDYFERFTSIESATVMVQKEVADRMAAQPGSKTYGAYTVKLRLYATCGARFAVSPGNFLPQPRVESAVIRLDRATHYNGAMPLDEATIKASCTIADAAFATRRKTLANSCKAYFADCGAEGQRIIKVLPQIFEQANVNASRRGEMLDLDEFIRLGQAFKHMSSIS